MRLCVIERHILPSVLGKFFDKGGIARSPYIPQHELPSLYAFGLTSFIARELIYDSINGWTSSRAVRPDMRTAQRGGREKNKCGYAHSSLMTPRLVSGPLPPRGAWGVSSFSPTITGREVVPGADNLIQVAVKPLKTAVDSQSAASNFCIQNTET